MDIHLTPGHLLYLASGIVFGTSALFHVAYYIGKFVGRLERIERDVTQLQEAVVELKTGA